VKTIGATNFFTPIHHRRLAVIAFCMNQIGRAKPMRELCDAMMRSRLVIRFVFDGVLFGRGALPYTSTTGNLVLFVLSSGNWRSVSCQDTTSHSTLDQSVQLSS
jgi:hypothetical protein